MYFQVQTYFEITTTERKYDSASCSPQVQFNTSQKMATEEKKKKLDGISQSVSLTKETIVNSPIAQIKSADMVLSNTARLLARN